MVIGENYESTKELVANNENAKEIEYIGISQRIHRMKPSLDSENLANFKREVVKHGSYYVAPAKQIDDHERGIGFRIQMDCKILKRIIEFRMYDDVPESDDPDSILKSESFLKYKF